MADGYLWSYFLARKDLMAACILTTLSCILLCLNTTNGEKAGFYYFCPKKLFFADFDLFFYLGLSTLTYLGFLGFFIIFSCCKVGFFLCPFFGLLGDLDCSILMLCFTIEFFLYLLTRCSTSSSGSLNVD